MSGDQQTFSAPVVPFHPRRDTMESAGQADGTPDRELSGDAPQGPAVTPDIDALRNHGVPDNVIYLASRLARMRGTRAREELLAGGFDRHRYWSIVAQDLGVGYAQELGQAVLLSDAGRVTADAVRLASSVLVEIDGETVLVMAPPPHELPYIKARLRSRPGLSERIRIAPPETIRAFLVHRRHAALAYYAVNRLARVLPRFSSRDLLRSDRMKGPLTLAAAFLAMGMVAPSTTFSVAAAALTVFFFNCGVWKAMAAFRRPRVMKVEPVPSRSLPTYTVLVPLYKEAALVGDLVRRLCALQYPASKLQIVFLLEVDDPASRAEIARQVASPGFEVIVVPPGEPRTKPKALTYALVFARGDLVVVYDAEDRPEPDQLRKAAAAFRDRPELGCVQARLAPDNEGSWFARMFKLEYAANFEVLLPALADAHVPLPLGGTSNHFPRAVLERVAAWDPFNVTEDADLGIRLARFGYRTATILSRTYEEAPVTFRQWLPQRRRWIKGWMQTSLLSLAGPAPDGLRLSFRDWLAVHGIISAGVLGLLIYPVSVLYFVWGIDFLLRGTWPGDFWSWLFFALNGNLVVILAAAAVSAFRGLRAVGALHLAPLIPLLPVYWAFMSFAAWHALIQLWRNPSVWEKTTHGVARDRRTPDGC